MDEGLFSFWGILDFLSTGILDSSHVVYSRFDSIKEGGLSNFWLKRRLNDYHRFSTPVTHKRVMSTLPSVDRGILINDSVFSNTGAL